MLQTRANEAAGQGADIKKGTFLFQPIETINVAKAKGLKDIVDGKSDDRRTNYWAYSMFLQLLEGTPNF